MIHYSVATLLFFWFSSFVLRFSDSCPIVSILHSFKISFFLWLPFLRKRSLQTFIVLVFSAIKQNKRARLGIFLLLQAIKWNKRASHVIFLLLYGTGRNNLETSVKFRALQEKIGESSDNSTLKSEESYNRRLVLNTSLHRRMVKLRKSVELDRRTVHLHQLY